jgi:hypothetical protein
MYEYLYAIVERLPERWRAPGAGIGSGRVSVLIAGDLCVVTSPVERAPAQTPNTLAAHHEVVASTMRAPAVLPLHFGTLVPAEELPRWLAANDSLVRATLGAVRGCVEMSVKLLRLEPGRARTTGDAEGRQLRALCELLVERAGVGGWRYRSDGRGGNVAAAVAFLVPRRDVPGFLSRIAPVASRATGMAVVPTGPWPPYSFVPTFERLPAGTAATTIGPVWSHGGRLAV